MIYYLLLLLSSAQTDFPECNWDYGIPGEHNKISDGDVRRNLIVNGEASQPHEYPWQVSIEATYVCGGSIIGRQYVLTAAHCFGGIPTVVAGLNRYRITGTWITHEEYDDANILNDIAIIRLDEPLPCDDPTVNAIALPEFAPGFTLDECSAWVTGFGALEEGGFSPYGYNMHELQTKVYSTETCNRSPENVYNLPSTQICGFTPGKPTEDSCQGDSGGPFKIDMNADSQAYHKYVQVGVVSYGSGCGRFAGIYTDVSEYKAWVLSKAPTARFETISACDKSSYHEGMIDCEGRDCNVQLPYCRGDSSTWRSEQNTQCSSFTNTQITCHSHKGQNLFASQVCPQCGYCRQGEESTNLQLTDDDECEGNLVEVDIEITTTTWAKEISFDIGGTCSGSGFANHGNYTSTCCLPPGDHVVNCRDVYGDGWHGAQLLLDGKLQCGEFESEVFSDSFFVAAESANSSSSSGSAIAIGLVVPTLFIIILCACWFYIWPVYGSKAMDACEDCLKSSKSYDPESRAPLSPRVKSEFASPAPIAPASGPNRVRGSSYWNNFHTGPRPATKALPQAPSIAARAKAFNTRAVAPPMPPKTITWHYTGLDGSDCGPVNDADFKSKIGSEIKEETYVWNGETVLDWTYAKDVAELKKFFTKRSAPPPAHNDVDSETNWHYVDASGTDVGPVSGNIFKQKIGTDVKEDTHVWNGTTVTDWKFAKDVSELKELFEQKKPVRRMPPKFSKFGTRNNNRFNSPQKKKMAFASKRTKSNGVSDLVARFQQQ